MSKDQFDNIDVNKIPEDQLDDVLKELNDLTRLTPKEWKPHAKQLDFHCAGNKYRVFLGGNRSGKTEAGVLESLMHMTGKYPEWYPKELRLKTPNKGRIIVTDFTKGFGETVLPKLRRWLPQEYIKSEKKNHEGFPVKFELWNGSTFDVCTYQQEDELYEGWSGHWAWFDEPPPRTKWVATTRGLIDYGGRAWLTLTPISEPWIWDDLVLRTDGRVHITTVDMRDNPYIKEDDIADFEKGLKEDEKAARLHGKFLHLSGLVYKGFDRSVHMVDLNLHSKDSIYAKMKKQWFFVLDPHDRRPHCGIWAFVNPNGKVFVAYELFMEGTITEISAHILAFERAHNIPSWQVMRIGDPNKMETPSAVSGLKLKDEFYKRDKQLFFITKIDDDIARGHMAVKEYLSWNKEKPLDEFNSPRIRFNSLIEVPHVIEMVERYGYLEWRGNMKDSKNARETPRDVNKDFPDCIRYLVMADPVYWEPREYSDKESYTSSSRTGYR